LGHKIFKLILEFIKMPRWAILGDIGDEFAEKAFKMLKKLSIIYKPAFITL